jgi:diguanylate cyclase (GGDEF)-like protein
MRKEGRTRYIFVILAMLIGFVVYLEYSIAESTRRLHELEINKAEQYARKISGYLVSQADGKLDEELKKNPQKRDALNNMLGAFLNDEFQYLFIVKRDKLGVYRFLLDGSSEDRAEYNAPFFPKSTMFDKVYQEGKAQIIEQSDNSGIAEVWKSLVYPIREDNQTSALLVMDLSKQYAAYLSGLNTPLSKTVYAMQWFLIVSVLFLLYVGYTYKKLKKVMTTDKDTGSKTKLFLQDFFYRRKLQDYYMALLNVDTFGRVNEIVGFENGTRILRELVSHMYTILPKGSEVIRLSGTEFLLLIAPEGSIEALIPKLFVSISEKSYMVGDETVQLTVSLSAMKVPGGITIPEKALHILDKRMLEIKSRGKNAYSIIGDQSGDNIKYGDIDYIKQALDEERFTCLYQPIYETRSKKIVKYEALVRMVDDEDSSKYISPFFFLSVIKGTSQYMRMTKLVMKEVFKVLNSYEDIEISINVDLTDLFNQEIMVLITNELYRHQELAKRLTFEIVEDMEVKNYEETDVVFEQLRHYGSKIALDDFGSGYANYNHLIQLDWDVIKIDGTLVKEIKNNPERAKMILQSINELGVHFQCQVVAEFVADEEIYHAIQELCIAYSQGFYLGEPKPIEAYIQNVQ